MALLCSHQIFQKAIFWKYSKTVSIRAHLEARLCPSFMQSCWQAHLYPLWSCVQAALRSGWTCNTSTDTIACQRLTWEQELQGGCACIAQWLCTENWLKRLSEWALSNKLHIPTTVLSNDTFNKPNFWVCVYLPLEDISGNKAEGSWWSVMDRDE